MENDNPWGLLSSLLIKGQWLYQLHEHISINSVRFSYKGMVLYAKALYALFLCTEFEIIRIWNIYLLWINEFEKNHFKI